MRQELTTSVKWTDRRIGEVPAVCLLPYFFASLFPQEEKSGTLKEIICHKRGRTTLLFDTHMHTQFSTDSTMLLSDALDRAGQLGIGITLTEHMDLAYPGEPASFVFDVDDYFSAYGPYRSDEMLLGVEIGMRPDCLEDNRSIAQGYQFDFVIGSIHVIDDIDIYSADFYNGRTKKAVYGQYFDAMAQCLETYDFIHSLGHIDYIARYARFPDPEVYYHEHSAQIDRVLAAAAAGGKAMEINTRRLDSQERIAAIVPIYKRFAELGGKLVTIGSDAHRAADIGRRLKTAIDIAHACNLTPVYYKNGNPLSIT